MDKSFTIDGKEVRGVVSVEVPAAERGPVNLAPHLLPPPASVEELYGMGAHLNRPEQLAPVGCWLIIEVGGRLFHGRRTSYVESKNREMDYELTDGTRISGRYRWTAP